MSSISPFSRSPILAIENAAATTIQAAWKGFHVRSIMKQGSDCMLCLEPLLESTLIKLDNCCKKWIHQDCLIEHISRGSLVNYKCMHCRSEKFPTKIQELIYMHLRSRRQIEQMLDRLGQAGNFLLYAIPKAVQWLALAASTYTLLDSFFNFSQSESTDPVRLQPMDPFANAIDRSESEIKSLKILLFCLSIYAALQFYAHFTNTHQN